MYNDDTTRLHDESTDVIKHSPEDGEVVDVTADIEVYFTRDINVNTLEGNFHVINNHNDNSVPGRFDYDKNDNKVTYFIDLLEENTPYRVYIDGVEDLFGNEIAIHSFEFRTKELEILEKHPPQIVKPANNSVVEESTVSWTTFHDYEGNYDLEIATDNRFSNTVYSVETSATEITPDIDYGETYYARVKYDENLSDSIAKDKVEITVSDDEVSYVHLDNYYKYKYGEKIYSISRVYKKAGGSLEVIDSGHSDEGEVYIKDNESDSIVLDLKLGEEEIVVIELYHYVKSEREWSDAVSFYLKELEYEDLSDMFSDETESSSFIEIVEPEDKNLVPPNIESISFKINSDIIEKEDIDIDITGVANNLPELQSLYNEHKVDGVIENFNQRSGYTIFDYVFKYIDTGKIKKFSTRSITEVEGEINTLTTISEYMALGQINTLFTVYSSNGSTNSFTTGDEIDTEEPYSIYTYDDLKRVGTGENGWDLDSEYIQENDIEVTDEEFEPIGINSDDDFTGKYDGQGYKIIDLTIDNSSSDTGFISHNRGTIKNLIIENPDINGGDENTGVVVGVNRDEGFIEKVGIIDGEVYGTNRLGGIAGTNAGRIENSYADTYISGEDYLGGITGFNASEYMDKVYSASIIDGTDYVSGLAGDSTEYVDSNTCFWDTDEGPDESSGGGSGLTTEEMQDISTYSFWDIENVDSKEEPADNSTWSIVDGETYPFLF